jgi:hypothetical protein
MWPVTKAQYNYQHSHLGHEPMPELGLTGRVDLFLLRLTATQDGRWQVGSGFCGEYMSSFLQPFQHLVLDEAGNVYVQDDQAYQRMRPEERNEPESYSAYWRFRLPIRIVSDNNGGWFVGLFNQQVKLHVSRSAAWTSKDQVWFIDSDERSFGEVTGIAEYGYVILLEGI